MTRYLSGIVAAVFAIGAVAFTAPKNNGPLATYTFYYTPTTNYSQPQVQNNNNWISGASLCGGVPDKACQIEVANSYTHLNGSIRVLNTTGNVPVINAKLGADGTDFVPDPSISTGINSATDKP